MATAEIMPKDAIAPVGSERGERRRPREERRRPPSARSAASEGVPEDEPPRPPRGRLDVLV